MRMNIVTAALIFTLSFLEPSANGVGHAAAANHPLSVSAAFSLCRAHQTARRDIGVRGWFVETVSTYKYLEGGLFNSRRAIPTTTYDHWKGNWKRYGALYVYIATQASFGNLPVTLHGWLDCASYRFWTDRDPFPLPHVKPVYGITRVPRTDAVSTWVVASGLKLTLVVPRRSYPRNALAQVQVSMQNVSHHDIGYWNPGQSPPGVTAPQPEVLDSSGQIVYPPDMPYWPPLPGPAPALAPLHPGQTLGWAEDIVVRGAHIRVSQPFIPRYIPNVLWPLDTLYTRPITVRLTVESAPHVAVRETPNGPVADVTRPAGMTGRMQLLNYTDCGFGASGGPNFQYSFGWFDSGLHLTPGCLPVVAWHFRVAWLNHPVTAIDYVPAQPDPTATSTSKPDTTVRALVPSAPAFAEPMADTEQHFPWPGTLAGQVSCDSIRYKRLGEGVPLRVDTSRSGCFSRKWTEE